MRSHNRYLRVSPPLCIPTAVSRRLRFGPDQLFSIQVSGLLLDIRKATTSSSAARGVPFSSGAIGEPGFAIVHASFAPLVRLSDGYGAIERQLHVVGRPLNAVCGIELRIPAAFTPQEFEQFNRAYLERIAAWETS